MKLTLFFCLMIISNLSLASEEFTMKRAASRTYDSCEGIPIPNLEREAKSNTIFAAVKHCDGEVTRVSSWSVKTERLYPNLVFVCIDQTVASATFQCL